MAKNDMIRPKEAAEILGVHVGTLANWRTAGVGPEWDKASMSPTARITYSRREVEAFKKTMRGLVRRR